MAEWSEEKKLETQRITISDLECHVEVLASRVRDLMARALPGHNSGVEMARALHALNECVAALNLLNRLYDYPWDREIQ